jgi:hypothetical protein
VRTTYLPRGFRAALALALALVAVAASAEEPPSSISPVDGLATLWVTLQSRLVTACRSSHTQERVVCSPSTQPTRAKISITLHPVREASLRSRNDPRVPLTLSIDSGDRDPGKVALQPGLWRLQWSGYSKPRVFRARAGDGLQLVLSVSHGRCESKAEECKLLSSVTERSAEIRTR